jgi:hypothetical protein
VRYKKLGYTRREEGGHAEREKKAMSDHTTETGFKDIVQDILKVIVDLTGEEMRFSLSQGENTRSLSLSLY